MKIKGFRAFAATIAVLFGLSNGQVMGQSNFQYLISDQEAAQEAAPAPAAEADEAVADVDAGVASNEINFGGWLQGGYHTYNTGMFNNRDNEFNLNQAYVYAEKAANPDAGVFGMGFRMDYVYGTDGPDTQAFFGPPTSWDNTWDNGGFYGHAIPQLYGEVAMGDVSVKVGKFYTIVGYETVTAPDNFFYSHAYTMYNSEPFTHTGVLATMDMGDVTLYNGWTTGWDAGFGKSVPGGSSYLGGATFSFGDCGSLTGTTTLGRLGAGSVEDGSSYSIVLDLNLTDRMNFVLQHDNVHNPAANQSYGVNGYLFYELSESVSLGTRIEWWNTHLAGAATGASDLYNVTHGMNIKLTDNFMIRPEVRWDRDSDSILIDPADDQRIGFGMDWIWTY